MRAFIVLGFVFSIPSQEIGLGKRLRNNLFCVEWDVKPQLSQSVLIQSCALLRAWLSFCGMVWYGMVNVDLYSAIITKVSNALDTLVSCDVTESVVTVRSPFMGV